VRFTRGTRARVEHFWRSLESSSGTPVWLGLAYEPGVMGMIMSVPIWLLASVWECHPNGAVILRAWVDAARATRRGLTRKEPVFERHG
jgi:hypothetical protein